MTPDLKNKLDRFSERVIHDQRFILDRPERFLSLLVDHLIFFFAKETYADPAVLISIPDGSPYHKLGDQVGNILTTVYIDEIEYQWIQNHFYLSATDQLEAVGFPYLVATSDKLNYPNNRNLAAKNLALVLPIRKNDQLVAKIEIILDLKQFDCKGKSEYLAMTDNEYPAIGYMMSLISSILDKFESDFDLSMGYSQPQNRFMNLPSVLETKRSFIKNLTTYSINSSDQQFISLYRDHFFVLDGIFSNLQKNMELYLIQNGHRVSEKDPFSFIFSYGTPADKIDDTRYMSYFLTSNQVAHLFASNTRKQKNIFTFDEFRDFWLYSFPLNGGAGLSGQVLHSNQSYYIERQEFAPQWHKWIANTKNERLKTAAQEQWKLFLKALQVDPSQISSTFFMPIITTVNQNRNREILVMVQCLLKNEEILTLQDRRTLYDFVIKASPGIEMALTSLEELRRLADERARAEEWRILFYTTSHHMKTPLNIAKLETDEMLEKDTVRKDPSRAAQNLSNIQQSLNTSLNTVDLIMNACYSQNPVIDEKQETERIDVYDVTYRQTKIIEELIESGGDDKTPIEKIRDFRTRYHKLFIIEAPATSLPTKIELYRSNLEVVLLELLKNAIRYSYKSPPIIRFLQHQSQPHDSEFTIEIRNHVHPATVERRRKDLGAGSVPKYSVGLKGTFLICKHLGWNLDIWIESDECIAQLRLHNHVGGQNEAQ